MAKRKASGRTKRARPAAKASARRAVRRPRSAAKHLKAARRSSRKTATRRRIVRTRAKATPATPAAKRVAPKRPAAKAAKRPLASRPSQPSQPTRISRRAQAAITAKARIERTRRRLDEVVPTPPSSLDLKRRGSAVRTGRAEAAEALHDHSGMTPSITAGDVDTDIEQAYFSGEETPGGDNQTPDQDRVDDIGRALGVEYQDDEELKASDKIGERDKHRWELDPASSEDYRERRKEKE